MLLSFFPWSRAIPFAARPIGSLLLSRSVITAAAACQEYLCYSPAPRLCFTMLPFISAKKNWAVSFFVVVSDAYLAILSFRYTVPLRHWHALMLICAIRQLRGSSSGRDKHPPRQQASEEYLKEQNDRNYASGSLSEFTTPLLLPSVRQGFATAVPLNKGRQWTEEK
jgi:hypothetical protein